MILKASILTCIASILTAASAIQDSPEPQLLTFSRKLATPELHDRLTKRATDGTLSVPLQNYVYYYATEIEIGTPLQKLEVVIDTGSSDLWVMDSSNPYCSRRSRQTRDLDELLQRDLEPVYGNTRGFRNPHQKRASDTSSGDYRSADGDSINCTGLIFNNEKSSTFSFNQTDGQDFLIRYGDGTFAAGRWSTDTVKIGGASMNNATFALALRANSTQAIMGVGFRGLETTEEIIIQPSASTGIPTAATSTAGLDQVAHTEPHTYSNIPFQLFQENKISAYAYSLFLNDLEANTGSVLFGGVDHKKYTGNLQTVPLINIHPAVSDTPYEFNVVLNSVGLTDSKGKSATVVSAAVPVLLDSGTSLMYLPEVMVSSLAYILDYMYVDGVGYVGKCSVADSSRASMDFNFSGAVINVNLSEALFPLTYENGNTAKFTDGSDICMFGFLSTPSNFILGDTFLRNAYTVFDLANYEISMANAKLNETNSDVEKIGSSVPSATKAASYSSTQLATDSSQISVNTDVNLNFGVNPGDSLTIADGQSGFEPPGTSTPTTGNPRSTGGARTSSRDRSSDSVRITVGGSLIALLTSSLMMMIFI